MYYFHTVKVFFVVFIFWKKKKEKLELIASIKCLIDAGKHLYIFKLTRFFFWIIKRKIDMKTGAKNDIKKYYFNLEWRCQVHVCSIFLEILHFHTFDVDDKRGLYEGGGWQRRCIIKNYLYKICATVAC